MSDGKGCECGARYYGECACDDVSWACGDCEEKDKRIAELEDKLAMAEQISGEYCDKCGWAMKFPDEPCRCELVKRIAELEASCKHWKNLLFQEMENGNLKNDFIIEQLKKEKEPSENE